MQNTVFCISNTYLNFKLQIHPKSASTTTHRGVARGGRPASGVTTLGWHHIIMWNHNSTDLWWILFHFVWSSTFSFGLKTHWFLAKTFFLVFTYFWSENPLISKRRPFFWSSPIFGMKKGATTKSRPGCHHFWQRLWPPTHTQCERVEASHNFY